MPQGQIGVSMRITSLLLAAGAVGLFAAGCGSSSSSSTSTSKTLQTKSAGVQISSRNVPGVGVVLVDGHGRTLYTFAPDNAKKVTCTGGCAAVWPPVTLPGTSSAVAAGAVKASLLGSDPNPSGGRVVTYKGWPLYNYVADPTPGSAFGEAVNSSGGVWYVISPTGAVIKHKS
jgi:predicted lipoprotein with Yx(FWY)xxD motif